MNNSPRFAALIAALLSVSTYTAVAQTEKTLELETDDGTINVPLDGTVPLRVLGDGDISATAAEGFSCPTGGPSCEDVQVSLLTDDGGSFDASPNPVALGSGVSFSWDSLGAWSCSGAGLPGTTWNGINPKRPRGQQMVNTSSLTAGDSYTVELICSNGPVTDSRTLVLEVQEDTAPPPPEGCEGVGELSDYAEWTESTDLRFGTPPSWEGSFGNGFPKGNTFELKLDKGEYAALRFTTPSYIGAASTGQINGETSASQSYGPGQRLMSITPCPGQFNPAEIDDSRCLIAQMNTGDQFKWVGAGHSQAQYRCELEPDTTYFLNILFSESPTGVLPPVQSECASAGHSACGMKLEPRDNNS
ncbi:MAG: hypothetical protein U5L08_12550 [Xanthomonadales bacterium]|nr:hypothetical protein [Xanthomonadales bacterium]